jgi:hydrogenase maturation protease
MGWCSTGCAANAHAIHAAPCEEIPWVHLLGMHILGVQLPDEPVMLSGVLLIGYGNPLRGDDALGPMAVERLRPLLKGAELLSCQQLAPELAERLARCELALFVDASARGEPGAVRVQRLRPQAEVNPSLTHHLHPAALLELARALYGRAPEAMLVTGAGETFESREALSEKGREALHEISRLIPLLIQNFRANQEAAPADRTR